MNKSDLTKSRILQVSLDMFNELGPDNVSTVLIFKTLKISPGNLYYYFKNKEEIIRAIYEQMTIEYEENWNISEMNGADSKISDKIVQNLRIFYKYRFLVNHMSALLNNDPILKEKYNEITKQRQLELGTYFLTLEQIGIMNFGKNPDAVKQLVSLLWFIGEFWLMNYELNHGKIIALTETHEKEYLQMNHYLTSRYLTEKGLSYLAEMHK
ncbi:MAG: TetR/AcrR family transcriptional regulator [Candidatus Cloacimonetes bacterium]|nr:TetR/AcrR family transcriptional regulator [Candidatus Cloacimonadota bacterium]